MIATTTLKQNSFSAKGSLYNQIDRSNRKHLYNFNECIYNTVEIGSWNTPQIETLKKIIIIIII